MTSIIKQLREQKGISQNEVACALGVSRPTIVNIEQGKTELNLSQIKKVCALFEITSDVLLQNKLPQDPEINFRKEKIGTDKPQNTVRIDVPQESVLKFKEVLLYILGKIGARANVGQTVLYKLLYFIDFDYYEKFEEQLVGAVYIKNHYGPTPIAFSKIIDSMIKNGDLEKVSSKYFGHEQTKYLPHRDADIRHFSGREIKHIDGVVEKLGNKSAKELSDLSHKDVPWIVAEEGNVLKYESVFYRTEDTSVREY